MGMIDYVEVDDSITLPYLPEVLTEKDILWQSKDIGRPIGDTYKITGDGRLLKKEVTYREKTEEEKQAHAETYGFDSWGRYRDAHEQALDTDDNPFQKLDDITPDDVTPEITVRTQVVETEEWVDTERHGSFEFHHHTKAFEDIDFDGFFSYEARFSDGTLDEILFLGERRTDTSKDEFIARIEDHFDDL